MKRVFALLLAAAACLGLCACGGAKTVSIDISALADDLAKNVNYEIELAPLDEDITDNVYGLPDGVEARAYASGGATADEIAVFKAADEKTAKQVLDLVQSRLSDRIDGYSSYMPDEVYKLNNAILKQEGCYVIYCVANDFEGAQKIVDKYLGK